MLGALRTSGRDMFKNTFPVPAEFVTQVTITKTTEAPTGPAPCIAHLKNLAGKPRYGGDRSHPVQRLLQLIPAVLTVLEPRSPLIVQRPGREPPPELEVAAVENAVAVTRPGSSYAGS